MADTERLINKAQGDSIISAIQSITTRLQEMYTVDDALSGTSENPVQNKVVTEALNGKVDKVVGKGLSTNDYTNEEKALVATIPDKADNVDVTEVDTSNTTPFLYRQTPYNADGVFLDELVGCSFGVNQLVPNNDKSKSVTIDSYNYADIEVINNNISTPHFLLAKMSAKVDSGTAHFHVIGNDENDNIVDIGCATTITTTEQYVYILCKLKDYMANYGIILRAYGTEGQVYSCDDLNVIDLTQMFGTTIADYIYSLEQATAGSGIAWLKSHGFFTKNYYPYNTGELISVKTSGKKYVGFNQNEEHSYDISNIDLRGIPKLVNNELVYDGDTYESNGDVTRKYGIVDLGTLNWNTRTQVGDNSYSYFVADLPQTGKDYGNWNYPNAILNAKYSPNNYFSQWYGGDNRLNNSYGLNQTEIGITDDSYSDAATFKTAMSGVYFIYELATPTTETTDPYTNPQICDKDGTEEFIDDRTVPVPVGHNSRYADLPAIMDGDYLSYMAKNFASEEYVDRQVKGEIEKHLEMPWVKVIDNDTTIDFDGIPIEYAQEYAYVLADNEFFKHRFILLEIYEMVGGLIRSYVSGSALLSIDTLLEFSGNAYGEMISFSRNYTIVEVLVGIVDDDGVYKLTISLENDGQTQFNDFRARARYVD